jgi:hypothetical protein
MKKIIFVLFAVVLFTSCTDNDESDTDDSETGSTHKTGGKKQQDKKSSIKLDFFPVPSVIDGCSAAFTYDTCKKNNGKYLFVTDYDNNNFIKIKGKQIRLKKDTVESKEISKTNYIDVYRGGGYKVILKLKIVKQYEEAADYKGTLQVTGNKAESTFKIHGTGGC